MDFFSKCKLILYVILGALDYGFRKIKLNTNNNNL